ncbi:MAG: S41 family peptidase [Rikenellaceae bacterium]
MKSTAKRLYISTFALLVTLLNIGCTTDVIDRGTDNEEEEEELVDTFVVEWMDAILNTYYLYNDEYKTLDRDLSLSYDKFLDATLKSMTTNVLDYKDGSLYTGVYRTASTKATTRISDSKVNEITLGLAYVCYVAYSNSTSYGIGISAVYPDSPLSEAGVKRGDIIVGVNGESLTTSNINGWTQLILQPTFSNTTYSLDLEDGRSISVTSTSMQCNPILSSLIYEEGAKKIGYISYLSFDAAWDDELMAIMVNFKASGVTDLILDMRLNSGGYISTSNKLSSAIGGVSTEDQVFAYYTYNDTRMASLNDSYKVENFKSEWSKYHLDLDSFVCLVTGSTASASELVVNSLRGVDKDVILIGEQTEGKNVAMEVFDMSYESYDYSFYPISILVSNAKGFNDYANGLTVDYEVSDWGDAGENFKDFSAEEIMISTALSYIKTGLFTNDTTAPGEGSRSTSTTTIPKTRGRILSANSSLDGSILIR